ncbi:MAG: hypothetical protein FWD49_01250 [Firmicutes bacterium]|nr:hypothetical protein [Bacillota bacterium]
MDEQILLNKLELKLKEQLKNNPQLLLPYAHTINVAEAKYTNYLFGGSDERGLNKGRLIARILGYNIGNYLEFDKKIKQAVLEFPAIFKKGNEFGDVYEVDTVITGIIGRKARVLIAALVDRETSKVTTIYIKDVKEEKL